MSRHRTHYDRFFICSFLLWSPSNNRRCLPCVFCIARTRSTCKAAPPQFVATPLLARVNAQGSYCSANARAACWDEHQVCFSEHQQLVFCTSSDALSRTASGSCPGACESCYTTWLCVSLPMARSDCQEEEVRCKLSVASATRVSASEHELSSLEPIQVLFES